MYSIYARHVPNMGHSSLKSNTPRTYLLTRPLDRLWGWSGPILSYGAPPTALRTSANGGFMRKTNVNTSLQHAYGTARGVGGVRQTRPSQEKPGGQVAGRAACTSILQVSCVHRLKIT